MHNFTFELLSLEDKGYKDFSKKLIPGTKYEIIGVRAPLIKQMAKKNISNNLEINAFFKEKHAYHEEFVLHGLLLSFEKDIDVLITKLKCFVQSIDNWAVCDTTVMALKQLKMHPEKALNFIKVCLKSAKPYVVRFGIVCLLCYFLDDKFNPDILQLISPIKSEHYYVNMGLAWLYSVALVKQYNDTVWIFESNVLPKFVHNKSIQKAIESYRITSETKSYLKTLKI